MDCYYSKMQTFRHFLFLNHRRKFGGSNFCRTLEFLHSSKASNRDIYSFASVLQTSNHNTNNNRGTGFRRAWIHTKGRRLMPDTNYSSTNSTSGRSSNGSDCDLGSYLPTRRKAGKCKVSWVCENCGDSFGQWWGACKTCGKVDSLKKIIIEESVPGWLGGGAGVRAAESNIGGYKPENNFREHEAQVGNRSVTNNLQPQRLSDVKQGLDAKPWRIPLVGTFGIEVGKVLGGGLVPGSVILVGGDPGVGKSTLLLQMCAILSKGCEVDKPAPVLYVSGEESVEQIGSRASRMDIDAKELFLYSGIDVQDIVEKVDEIGPKAVVVDSIQTVFLKDAPGSLGSVTQVKECATYLLRCAKKTRIPFFLVGHMTKSGDIAGPRILEHIVDVVLYLEGDRLLSHRILRTVKNRFGSTDEIGVLEMGEGGLQAITNPSELYISQRNIHQDVLVGLALTVIMDGSRPFLIEIQALYEKRLSDGPMIKRFNGVEDKRADIIIAVLGKQAGLNMQGSSIFLNVVGGVSLEETAADLAIAASICSSYKEVPIPINMAFIGEIGLGGELRTVARMEKRITELSKLGFTKCVIPASSMKSLSGHEFEGISIIYCKNLKEVIKIVFDIGPNPIPTLVDVMEGEDEQKGVNVSGDAGEKQGGGGQKDANMCAGDQKDMNVIVSGGEKHGVSVSAGGGRSIQNGEGRGWDWVSDVGGNVDEQKGMVRKPSPINYPPWGGGRGGDGGLGEQKGMVGRPPSLNHHPGGDRGGDGGMVGKIPIGRPPSLNHHLGGDRGGDGGMIGKIPIGRPPSLNHHLGGDRGGDVGMVGKIPTSTYSREDGGRGVQTNVSRERTHFFHHHEGGGYQRH